VFQASGARFRFCCHVAVRFLQAACVSTRHRPLYVQVMIKFIPLPSLEELHSLLELSPDSPTGLKWRNKGRGVKPNRVAGWWKEGEWGKIRINKKYYKTHRIVWALHTGEDPGENLIDHINRKPHDNRIENLRLVNPGENRYNSSSNKNLTGYRGVTKLQRCARWSAHIRKQGKNYYLGCFDSPEKAYRAYLDACQELYGYSPSVL